MMIHFLFPMCRCLNAMVEQSHPSHLHSQLFSSSDKNLVIGPPLLLLMYSSLKCFWGCPSSANNPPIPFPRQLPPYLSRTHPFGCQKARCPPLHPPLCLYCSSYSFLSSAWPNCCCPPPIRPCRWLVPPGSLAPVRPAKRPKHCLRNAQRRIIRRGEGLRRATQRKGWTMNCWMR